MENEFRCGNCGRPLQAGDASPGARILCAGCGSFTTVPVASGGGTIEFRCTGCQKLLRTPADTAGKQAKCPECGTVSAVPAAPQQKAAGAAAPPPPPPPVQPGSPFGAGGPVPGGAAWVANPYQSPMQGGPAPLGGQRPVPVGDVPNYLVQAILCTFFCCIPFGIVAIVYAAQVNSKLAAYDYQGAMSCSANARTWCWVSFLLGLVPVVLWIVAVVISAIGSAM